jgi:putative hydrolase of the HAD superfamily
LSALDAAEVYDHTPLRADVPLNWILFDLDGTLYPSSSGLLPEVGRRIQRWVADYLELSWDEAYRVRREYFQRYGTTLEGLIIEHGIDADDYLAFVHDISIEDYLAPDPALAAMLVGLPLQRGIYTNATTEYTWRVLRTLGVSDHFAQIVSIEVVGLRNKLFRDAYECALALINASGKECIMVEDSARNLRVAKELGMVTVLLTTDGGRSEQGQMEGSVDFLVDSVLDVGRVVHHIVGGRAP